MDKSGALVEIQELLENVGIEDSELVSQIEGILDEYEADHYEEAYGDGYDQALEDNHLA